MRGTTRYLGTRRILALMWLFKDIRCEYVTWIELDANRVPVARRRFLAFKNHYSMELNKMTVPQMLPSIRQSRSGQYLMWNIT